MAVLPVVGDVHPKLGFAEALLRLGSVFLLEYVDLLRDIVDLLGDVLLLGDLLVLLCRQVPFLGTPPLLGLALAHGEPVGEQDLVGGGAKVAAQVAAGGVPEDGARQLLDRGHRLGRRRSALGRRSRVAAP